MFDVAPYIAEAEKRDELLDALLGHELVAAHDATARYYRWQDRATGKWHEDDAIEGNFNFQTDDLLGILAGNPIVQFFIGLAFGKSFSPRTAKKIRGKLYDAEMRGREMAYYTKWRAKDIVDKSKEDVEMAKTAKLLKVYEKVFPYMPDAAMVELIKLGADDAIERLEPKIKEWSLKKDEKDKKIKDLEGALKEYAKENEALLRGMSGAGGYGGGALARCPYAGGAPLDPNQCPTKDDLERLTENVRKLQVRYLNG